MVQSILSLSCVKYCGVSKSVSRLCANLYFYEKAKRAQLLTFGLLASVSVRRPHRTTTFKLLFVKHVFVQGRCVQSRHDHFPSSRPFELSIHELFYRSTIMYEVCLSSHSIGGLVGPTVGLDDLEKRKISCLSRVSNCDSSVVQAVA